MNKKRILYLLPRLITGGAEKLVLEYAEYFSQRGYEVAVASLVGGGELADDFRVIGAKVLVGRNGGILAAGKNYITVKKFVKSWRPDIIHSNLFSGDFCGFLLRRKFKDFKWLSTVHGPENNLSFWKKYFWQVALRSADLVLVVSEVVRDFAEKVFGVIVAKITVLPNGVDLNKWSAARKYFEPGAPLSLAVIGRLEKEKGQDVLLLALAKIKSLAWNLNIYGDGTMRKDLEDLSKSLGLQKKITFFGLSNNLPAELAKIDLVIQPSRSEGNSLAVMEAMSAGKIVIATTPAAEGILVDRLTGIVVKPEDTAALASAIQLIIEKKELGETMAIKAQEYAMANFSIKKHLQQLEKLYNKL